MNKLRVLFASFEASPFIKTGGLGDVAAALPGAVQSPDIEVRVVLPKLEQIGEEYKKEMRFVCSFYVPLAWRNQYCGLFELQRGGVTWYFLDNEYYFKRPEPYGYYDDAERMAYFSRAVCECCRYLPGFFPDILHCNDWHTALVPVFLRELYGESPGVRDEFSSREPGALARGRAPRRRVDRDPLLRRRALRRQRKAQPRAAAHRPHRLPRAETIAAYYRAASGRYADQTHRSPKASPEKASTNTRR